VERYKRLRALNTTRASLNSRLGSKKEVKKKIDADGQTNGQTDCQTGGQGSSDACCIDYSDVAFNNIFAPGENVWSSNLAHTTAAYDTAVPTTC